MQIDKDALFIVDGSYLLYRSFYAIRPLYTIDGIPTQATYGFVRALKKIIDDYHPRHLVIAWDAKGPTFRNELYAEYKATRQTAPDQLITQKNDIIDILTTMGIMQIAVPGFEADDLIYSLVQDFKDKNIVLVCPDKDLFQLLSDHVIIFDPFKGRLVDAVLYEQEKEMPVRKIAFYHALLGDASDNIPGVKGIGQKTALDLVKQFDDLDDLYRRLDEVKKDRIRLLLATQKEQAFLSLELFSFRYCKTDVSFSRVIFNKEQWQRARAHFERLEFKSLIADIDARAARSLSPVVPHDEEKAVVYDWECVVITTEQALEALANDLKNAKILALDTETTGVNALRDRLVGLSLAYSQDRAFYIPVGHSHGEQLALDVVLKILQPIFKDEGIGKVLHNAKFDYLVLHNHGFVVEGIVFDTMLAANLLRNAWQKIGLKDLSSFFLHETMQTYEDVVGKKLASFAHVAIDQGARYAAHDALQTLKLYHVLLKQLENDIALQQLFERVEMPLMKVLCAMELEGVELDVQELALVEKRVDQERRTIEEKFFAALEDIVNPLSFNMNSPKQVEWLLFDRLKLPVVKKSATGLRSTDQEVLEELAKVSPIAGLIVRYRELTKLKTTYLQPLPEAINPKTGKIHTSYSQTMVATGRLSSSQPNLQNIPTGSEFGLQIRAAFKPPKNKLFLSADYSQIELRVLAHMSGDKALKDAFIHHQDIHLQTAAQLFGVDQASVTHEQRQLGKKINFSIIYGLTPFGLSKDLGIKPQQAKVYIDAYFKQYPGVGVWIDQLVQEAIERGYVQTLWGHRRYVPGLREKNKNLYEAERRIAVNTPVQGTAADLMKFAMLRLDRLFKESDIDAEIVLQIHDELVIQFLPVDQERVCGVVKQAMEQVVEWDIPLSVSIRTGADWGLVTK